jgi:pre-mRNA-splicing helicase BRR2
LEKKKAVEATEPTEKTAAKCEAAPAGFGSANIIEATQGIEGLTYRPHIAKTR